MNENRWFYSKQNLLKEFRNLKKNLFKPEIHIEIKVIKNGKLNLKGTK